jgi:hypothetical protein
MSAYRYVVFPRGKQPTDIEVREFQRFAGALANQFAFGTCRDDGRLVVAVDRQAFDHVLKIDAGFEAIIRRWEARGCELADHLAFVKNAAALRPTPANLWQAHDGRGTVQALRNDEQRAFKELAAREAIGRSLLSVERTLEQFAVVQRVAAAMPYVLIGLGAAVTIAAGLYVRDRMENSKQERRQETIERVAEDPLDESLAAESLEPPAAAAKSFRASRQLNNPPAAHELKDQHDQRDDQ